MVWAPDYITPQELAEYARGNVDRSQAALETACASGSRIVDEITGRQFGNAGPESRDYTALWSESKGMWQVVTDDFESTLAMTISFDTAKDGTYSTSIALTGAIPYPVNAPLKNKPYEGFYLRQGVSAGVDGRLAGFRVLNTWGWSAVPKTVLDATKLQGSRIIARRDSPFGVAGSPDNGSELRLLARADPDVVVMLKNYRRKVWAR